MMRGDSVFSNHLHANETQTKREQNKNKALTKRKRNANEKLRKVRENEIPPVYIYEYDAYVKTFESIVEKMSIGSYM